METIYYYDNKEYKDIELSVILLLKYLGKYYNSEDKAKEVIRNNRERLDILAKSLGRKNIEFFNLYFLRNLFIPNDHNAARVLSESHYDMWDLLNDTFIKDKYDKINIVAPRGWAKTTTCDMALSIWLICYKESVFTVIGAKTEVDCQQFIASIKKEIETNKLIERTFGKLIDKSNTSLRTNSLQIEFANRTCLRAVASGTSVRGINWKSVRPTCFIGDDFQSEINILTEDSREKLINKWQKEIEQCGDSAVYRKGIKIKKATKIVSIGTVLHIDCLISRLSRNNDYKTFLRRAVILKDDETVDDIFDTPLWIECKNIYLKEGKEEAEEFYKIHYDEMKFPVLWEEKWDCLNDIAVKFWENRTAFMSEMMNDATSIGVRFFKAFAEITPEELDKLHFVKTMLCVDPASTVTESSDYTAMVVGSQTNNTNFTYIRGGLLKRLDFNSYCLKVVELLKEFEDITHVYIEKNTFQGSDVIKIKDLIRNDPLLRNRHIEFINEMQKKNKDEKISTTIDPINNGQIQFNCCMEDIELIKSMYSEFCGCKYSRHDDICDCVAELNTRIKDIKNKASFSIIYR
jgi:hypothetical protein